MHILKAIIIPAALWSDAATSETVMRGDLVIAKGKVVDLRPASSSQTPRTVIPGLAEAHCQQDPTIRTVLSFTRLSAKEALQQLRAKGFAEEVLPSPSTMAEVLNRNGYRLRAVVKAKPQKKFRKPMPSSPTSRKRTGSAMKSRSCD